MARFVDANIANSKIPLKARATNHIKYFNLTTIFNVIIVRTVITVIM
jgi:hypothetical protein